MAHNPDGILEPNNTYINSTMMHVGQLFFDQSLINQTNEYAPYSTNTQALTLTYDDSILQTEWDDVDPLTSYVYLNGEDVSDGLLMWATLVVNQSASYTPSPAAYYYETGGVVNSDSTFAGSGGGGNGTMPSGSGDMSGMPSGTGAPPSSSSA